MLKSEEQSARLRKRIGKRRMEPERYAIRLFRPRRGEVPGRERRL
jgi:hypothetical protein